MNTKTLSPVLFVYQMICFYLENGDMRTFAEGALFGSTKSLEQFPGAVSWELTKEHLDQLDRCVNDSQNVSEDEWEEARNEFVIAAFKDLSDFRDPRATVLFNQLRRLCTVNDGELLMWSKKVIKRPDGSAVIVLHVSGGMILPEIRWSEIPFFFLGLFFRIFS